MSNNALKKMLIFSTDKSKIFFEGAITDDAQYNHNSFSGTVEKILSARYVPKNETAGGILLDLYEGIISIRDAAANFLNYLGGGGIEQVNPDAAKDLVTFCRDQFFSNSARQNIDPNPRLAFLLTGIEERLIADQRKDGSAPDLEFEIQTVKDIKDTVSNRIQELHVEDIYGIVISNWSSVSRMMTTYRLLAEVVKLHDWSKANRFVFAQILRSM